MNANTLPVYLDLEKTGLDQETDEILEIAILDHNENILLDSLVKPLFKSRWPEAQKINGITPEMVKDTPFIPDLWSKIINAVEGRDVYIWNASFDAVFLGCCLEYAKSVNCAMREYGEFIERTQPHNKSQSGRYKLENTAKDLGVEVAGNAHRARHDVIKMIRVRKAWRSVNVEAYR